MKIPNYPEFSPISLDFKDEMNKTLALLKDGVSEFTFAGLYLFRERYRYSVSTFGNEALVISGVDPSHHGEDDSAGKTFFLTPLETPDREMLGSLFGRFDYWKNIPDSIVIPNGDTLREWGVELLEDRDNFDYLYLRSDLAELKGKKFHKKRNLVAQFCAAYSAAEKPLAPELVPDALTVLEAWKEEKGFAGDYAAAREALEQLEEFGLSGRLFYIEGKPAAWCLGEPIAGGSAFTVHFEKAIESYKGIYQYVNQAFAASLPESVLHINREQDLGEEGLRHAKTSYRPSGFVRKHTGRLTP